MQLIRSNIARSYFLVLAIAAVLYIASCATGPLWQDSGMIQYRVWRNDIQGGLGLALAHPLFYIIAIIAKYIPIGQFGFRVNLVSALAGAFTVANVFLLLRIWLDKIFPAAVGALSLALSWTFWQHASMAETYTLYTALLTVELVLLLQYVRTDRVGFLYLLGLANGLAVANHMLGSIAAVCYAIFILVLVFRKSISIRQVIIFAGLWIIGALPYEYLVIKQMIVSGEIAGTLLSALFGQSWSGDALNISLTLRIIVENIAFIVYSFPTPNILLLLVGIYAIGKAFSDKKICVVLLAMLVLFFIFAFRYTVPDRYAFFIPFYCIATICIGVGVDIFTQRFDTKKISVFIAIMAILPIPVYAFTPMLAEKANVNLGTKRQIPYRNDYAYFLRPWQSFDKGPTRFGEEALKGVSSDSYICADGTTVYALWYAQTVNKINPGVKILALHGSYQNPVEYPTMAQFNRLIEDGRLFVVSNVKGYCQPEYLLDNCDFVKASVLYKVVPKNADKL